MLPAVILYVSLSPSASLAVRLEPNNTVEPEAVAEGIVVEEGGVIVGTVLVSTQEEKSIFTTGLDIVTVAPEIL